MNKTKEDGRSMVFSKARGDQVRVPSPEAIRGGLGSHSQVGGLV